MNLSTSDKIRALRDLTRGAEDCFAAFSLTTREGEARWRPVYSKLSDRTLHMHLAGYLEVGSYPLIPNIEWPRCYWVLADFDGKKEHTNWRKDVQRVCQFVAEIEGCPCFVNLSRSGEGAHVRMLFRDSVPAWLARRWFAAWLDEAGVIQNPENEWDDVLPPSFDRLIPPQDTLSGEVNEHGARMPGNLAGNPLHGKHVKHGGTIPLDPLQVARGNFEPDGKHWEHVMNALERREWGETELIAALPDCPGDVSSHPPAHVEWVSGMPRRALPVVQGDDRHLDMTIAFCEFFREMRRPGAQTYPLWVAMATQLHRFGEAGHEAWHQLSSLDPRYSASDCEKKWQQTRSMHPIRCDSLVQHGYRCPHLLTVRCNGAKAPSYFAEHTYAEIL